jgi:ABC-type sugar transport system ATPase subunit
VAQESDSRTNSTPGFADSLQATAPLLSARQLGKTFGGVPAITGIDLELKAGTILGVVGENGAGKSTLMKIICGVYPIGQYSGELLLKGNKTDFSSVASARNAGIVLIPQELHIAPELTVAENMFAGELPSRFGVLRVEDLVAAADKWLEFFSLAVRGDDLASILSPSQQRLAVMAGALSRDATVLVLDEPTAALSESESNMLFEHLRRLRAQGIGIIFISHRLDDIEKICDEIVVLRNGERVGGFDRSHFSRTEIVRMMIGDKEGVYDPHPGGGSTKDFVVEIENLTVVNPGHPQRARLKDLNLSIRAGEIVGMFGLVGAGRTEFARAIFGTWPGEVKGKITVRGKPYRPVQPREAVKAGIAFLTEDRKQSGIFHGHSLQSNISAASISSVSRAGIISVRKEFERARDKMRLLDVRAESETQAIDTLSGGNQQKVLLGRWLSTDPVLLILDEPTAGVDVGARGEIYSQITELVQKGCAVLVISSDMDEIRHLCSRIVVMFEGQITANYDSPVGRHELMASATGGR